MNVLTSNAQTTWVKDGKNNNSFKGVTDLIQLKKDSTYLLTCSYRFTYLLKLDSLGNIIKNMPITETNNYVSLANGIVEVNNKIYGIGDISGFGLWYNNLYIRATDEQSNNFWHHDIGDSINYNSTRKIKYKNNILHVLSVKNLDNLPTPSIINITKLDTNGIIVFSKDIPTDTIYKFEANAYDFEILSVLRNMKIIGIFSLKNKQDLATNVFNKKFPFLTIPSWSIKCVFVILLGSVSIKSQL